VEDRSGRADVYWNSWQCHLKCGCNHSRHQAATNICRLCYLGELTVGRGIDLTKSVDVGLFPDLLLHVDAC